MCVSLIEDGVRLVVSKESEVGFVQLVQFFAGLQGHGVEPVRLQGGGREVPTGCGELHHVVHLQLAQQMLGVLLHRLQMAHEVILDLARVAEAVHLPPVLVEGHLLLRLRVQEVLQEVGEGRVDAHAERLVRGGGRRRLVGVATQHDLGEAQVEICVGHLKFVPVGGDETHKGVTNEDELGVLLQLHLQKE